LTVLLTTLLDLVPLPMLTNACSWKQIVENAPVSVRIIGAWRLTKSSKHGATPSGSADITP
jgi:hypothetical protein